MATTPKTVKTYALNGSLKDFTIPFEYLARKFVAVTLIGATRKELVLNTDFRFSTPTTITTIRSSGWGPADNFDLIEIRRFTSATERLVDFADGSILRAYDLNTSQVQSLHIAEEARDLTADTIGVNNDGQLDARARRIVNLADAINPGDAVTLRQNQQWAGSALNQATLSAQSAAASEASRQVSTSQATASAASASASANSATASANSASASQASNQTAYRWANELENVVVNSGQYSAFHWVQKAIAQVALALGYANNSQTSANQAAQKVTDAAAQVTLATTQANNASASATAAANSATAAANSAASLGGMIGLGENVSSTVSGAGSWKVVFKGILQTVGKIIGLSFEAGAYTEAKGFATQKSTGSPYIVKGTVLNSASEYSPMIKNIVKVGAGGPDEAVSMGILSNPDGTQVLTFNWDYLGASPALMQLKRDGTQASVPKDFYAGQYLYESGSRVWTTATFNPTLKLSNNGNLTVNGTYNSANGVNYQNLSAANQVYNGAFEIRENGQVGAGGPAPGHIYNSPGIVFHWGATQVARLMMNNAGALCWGNPNGDYMTIAQNGIITGSAYGGSFSGWVDTYYTPRGGFAAQAVNSVNAGTLANVASLYNQSGAAQGNNAVLGGGSLQWASHNAVGGIVGGGSWRQNGWTNNGGVSNWQRIA